MRSMLGIVTVVVVLSACGGATSTPDGGAAGGSSSSSGGSSGSGSSSGTGSSSGGSSGGSGGGSSSGGTSAGSSSGTAVGPAPIDHRPDDSQCATPRPQGNCSFTGNGFMCTSDGECGDGGADGRCLASGGGVAGCFCTYDACQADTDCNAGKLCVCHGSAYSYGGNNCMPGNCRIDSDCGTGGYCSPSHGGMTSGCGYVTGYYCHTGKDLCTNDSDCTGAGCAWSGAEERWKCQMVFNCP